MILRRITKHVKDQNWFAVVLDFLIVVCGILIAFQITNWNEAREDRRDEQRYLVELARDLEADIAESQKVREASLAMLGLSELILTASFPDYERPSFWTHIDVEVVPSERFANYSYAALTSRASFDSSNFTFEELVQTGNIAVLSDRSFVSDMTKFYRGVRENTTDEQSLSKQTEAMLGFLRRNGMGIGDRATIDEAILLAGTDKEFLGLVKASAFLASWQYSRMIGIEENATALLMTAKASRKDTP